MFVQSEKYVEAHGGACFSLPRAAGDIAVYGQESNHTTWRLAKMSKPAARPCSTCQGGNLMGLGDLVIERSATAMGPAFPTDQDEHVTRAGARPI
jgi:hypothetical protein